MFKTDNDFIIFLVKLISDDLTDGDTPTDEEFFKVWTGLVERQIDPTEFDLFAYWDGIQ